jgi:hypothetical protein
MEIVNEINSMLSLMRKIKQDNNRYMQYPATKEEVDALCQVIKKKFDIELSPAYQKILMTTNGFRENGVQLYGTETRLQEGYKKEEIYVEGFLDANENWKHNIDFANHIVYAESDTYIFAQSSITKTYSCHKQGDFENSFIWETTNDNTFFEIILRLAVDDDFSIQDVL